ncbi:MAG: flagellar biosynthetic protein FliO [Fimbriimonadales bacterium]
MNLSSLIAGVSNSGLDGLKSDPMPPFSGGTAPVGVTTLIQMLVALGVVVAVIRFAIPKLGKRFAAKQSGKNSGSLELEETLNLGTHQVYVVRVGEKKLLVGGGAQGVNLIADLSEEAPFIPLSSPIQTLEGESAAFSGVFDRLRRLGG